MKKPYKFYCVTSEFYADGTVKAAITSSERTILPLRTSRNTPGMRAYRDWFLTEDTAAEFLAGVLAGSGEPGDVDYRVLAFQTTPDLYMAFYDAEINGKLYKSYAIGRVLMRRGKAYEEYKAFLKSKGLPGIDEIIAEEKTRSEGGSAA